MVRFFRAARRRRGTIWLLADSSVEISGIFFLIGFAWMKVLEKAAVSHAAKSVSKLPT